MFDTFSLMRAAALELLPVIETTPSVHIPRDCYHDRSIVKKIKVG